MNKLTAEKCRKEIEWVKSSHQAGMVTELTKLLLQALEIALPVLEQQESDGWIEWRGGASGSCPVAYMTLVEVKDRVGHVAEDRAEAFEWCHEADDDDIIAYRVVEQQEKAAGKHQEGE